MANLFGFRLRKHGPSKKNGAKERRGKQVRCQSYGGILEDSIREGLSQEAQDVNLKQYVSHNEDLMINKSEGDATESTIIKSTPHSKKVQYHKDIVKDIQEQRNTFPKNTAVDKQISGNLKNLGPIMKARVKNVAVQSNRSSKHETLFVSDEARLRTTKRFLPLQTIATFLDSKSSSECSTLGSGTTRLQPRLSLGV